MTSTKRKASTRPPRASAAKPRRLPLGYIWVDGAVRVDPKLAERIRQIFREYIAES